jgi:hypothetical protein
MLRTWVVLTLVYVVASSTSIPLVAPFAYALPRLAFFVLVCTAGRNAFVGRCRRLLAIAFDVHKTAIDALPFPVVALTMYQTTPFRTGIAALRVFARIVRRSGGLGVGDTFIVDTLLAGFAGDWCCIFDTPAATITSRPIEKAGPVAADLVAQVVAVPIPVPDMCIQMPPCERIAEMQGLITAIAPLVANIVLIPIEKLTMIGRILISLGRSCKELVVSRSPSQHCFTRTLSTLCAPLFLQLSPVLTLTMPKTSQQSADLSKV